MQKLLGDILVSSGHINGGDLNRALIYQMKKVVGKDSLASDDATESFILDIARKKFAGATGKERAAADVSTLA